MFLTLSISFLVIPSNILFKVLLILVIVYLLDFTDSFNSSRVEDVKILWYILFSIPSLTSKYVFKIFLSLTIIDDKISK